MFGLGIYNAQDGWARTSPMAQPSETHKWTWLTTVSSRTLFFEYLPSNPRTLGTLWSLHKEEQVVVGKGS
uniref:Uncharacterized protein n=1 Tax=Helianthus annuus TaxID=4232 RepID=A0A251TE72_HELAN